MYQAIHRSRLWLYKKQVYVFGLVPEEIRNEGVKVVEQRGDRILNKERVEWLLDYMKKTSEQPAAWARDDMAKHFRISKNRAYNIIRAIVEENKNVRSEKRRSIRWLMYVPTKEA